MKPSAKLDIRTTIAGCMILAKGAVVRPMFVALEVLCSDVSATCRNLPRIKWFSELEFHS